MNRDIKVRVYLPGWRGRTLQGNNGIVVVGSIGEQWEGGKGDKEEN